MKSILASGLYAIYTIQIILICGLCIAAFMHFDNTFIKVATAYTAITSGVVSLLLVGMFMFQIAMKKREKNKLLSALY